MSEEVHLPRELKCPNCLSDLPVLATSCDTCSKELQIVLTVEPLSDKREAYHAARLIAEFLPDSGTPVGTIATTLTTQRFSTPVPNYAAAQSLSEALQEQGVTASVRVNTRESSASAGGRAPFPPIEWIKQHPLMVGAAVLIVIAIGILNNPTVQDEINTAIQDERPTRTMEDIEAEQERARELLQGLEQRGQQHLQQQEEAAGGDEQLQETFRRNDAVLDNLFDQ